MRVKLVSYLMSMALVASFSAASAQETKPRLFNAPSSSDGAATAPKPLFLNAPTIAPPKNQGLRSQSVTSPMSDWERTMSAQIAQQQARTQAQLQQYNSQTVAEEEPPFVQRMREDEARRAKRLQELTDAINNAETPNEDGVSTFEENLSRTAVPQKNGDEDENPVIRRTVKPEPANQTPRRLFRTGN